MNIKEIEIGLENCESVIIPFDCFKEFDYISKDDTHISVLTCLIEDNGKSEYSSTFMNSKISPIQRLAKYDDIAYIEIHFVNGTSSFLYVIWHDGDDDNNKNQKSQLISYKEISIEIKPYIKTYSVTELFEFPNGTKFKIIDEVDSVNWKRVLFLQDGILKFKSIPEELITHNCSNQMPITKETVSFHYVLID